MTDLFSFSESKDLLPLAERSRPQDLNGIIGQAHLLNSKSPILSLLNKGQLLNLVLWGPPGTGKTTFALNLAKRSESHFIQMNATDAGVKDLKGACEIGRTNKLEQRRKTILFVDEIHRFNKSQQDVLLPYVERGDIYLIGATTELPSYELNKALLSRCQVLEFHKISEADLKIILTKACVNESVQLENILTNDGVEILIRFVDGDARRMLNMFEIILNVYLMETHKEIFPVSEASIEIFLNKRVLSYDKKSEQHYDCISAFIKSMRGSDPDAAIYYLARMLEGGEDPVFIARRMIVFASEDVGNADPRALPLAIACLQAVEAIGMPECRINLAQGVAMLASCPKSNSSYEAINMAMAYVQKNANHDVPSHLKSLGKSEGYKYPHAYDRGYVKQRYWPADMQPQKFYEPKNSGFEKNITEYLAWLKKD
jgi:putative ATPase